MVVVVVGQVGRKQIFVYKVSRNVSLYLQRSKAVLKGQESLFYCWPEQQGNLRVQGTNPSIFWSVFNVAIPLLGTEAYVQGVKLYKKLLDIHEITHHSLAVQSFFFSDVRNGRFFIVLQYRPVSENSKPIILDSLFKSRMRFLVCSLEILGSNKQPSHKEVMSLRLMHIAST